MSLINTDTAPIQRRTLGVLFASQVLGSVGTVVGISVGALLAADLLSVSVSGLAQSAYVLGAALLAVPATRIARAFGRGPSLAAAYLTGAVGGTFTVLGAMTRSPAPLFAGFFLFGAAGAANLQARFAAVDLAPPEKYGRHLSLIVWATTIGGVVGPNLASVAGTRLLRYGIPALAAPFVLASALFVLAAVLLVVLLRPDPLILAQRARAATAAAAPKAGMGVALRAVLASRDATLGLTATAVGHMVMVGVMAMTPVHIRGGGHGAADTLRIVGVVLSIHVAAMYACAPVMGWLCDRVGRRPVIVMGIALLAVACAVAGTAGYDTGRLSLGLMALGLGWSATMVGGSTLLSASVPAGLRTSAQGVSDVVMGLAGATAGALSGVVVQFSGYSTLTLLAALTTTPLVVLVLRGRAAAAATAPTSGTRSGT